MDVVLAHAFRLLRVVIGITVTAINGGNGEMQNVAASHIVYIQYTINNKQETRKGFNFFSLFIDDNCAITTNYIIAYLLHVDSDHVTQKYSHISVMFVLMNAAKGYVVMTRPLFLLN